MDLGRNGASPNKPESSQHNTPNEATTSPQTAEPLSDPASGLAEDLKNCDWDELLERYAAAMEEHGQADEEARHQTAQLYEVRTTTPLS